MMSACELCGGACCKSMTLPKKIFNEDVARWLGYHAVENDEVMRFNCACRMLHEGKCSIYENRPQMCKDYQVGSRACREAIKRYAPEKETQLFEMFG